MRKPTSGKINEAKNRVAKAQAAKRTVTFKPGAKPVFNRKHANAPIDGLPLKEMLRETTARTRQLMKQGDVSVINMRPSRSGRVLLTSTVTRHRDKANTYYKQAIRNEDSNATTFSSSRRIKVDCTCPQFKFTHDWTLHQKEASDLKHSDDEPSLIRNPQQLHGVCKHLLSVVNVIVKSGR